MGFWLGETNELLARVKTSVARTYVDGLVRRVDSASLDVLIESATRQKRRGFEHVIRKPLHGVNELTACP